MLRLQGALYKAPREGAWPLSSAESCFWPIPASYSVYRVWAVLLITDLNVEAEDKGRCPLEVWETALSFPSSALYSWTR